MNIVNMIKGLVRLAAIVSTADESGDFPIHKVTYMGKDADACAWYPYGYHANPSDDALAILLAIDANSENRSMLPGSPKERPKFLEKNEVVLFHPPTQSYIHLKADGSIDIDAKNHLNLTVAGNVVADVEGGLTAQVEGDLVADVEGNADIDIAGTTEIDSVGAATIVAPTLGITSDVTITGKLSTTGNADIGIGGVVGLGDLYGNLFGLNVARKGDATDDPTDQIIEGSTKVRAVGPAG